MQPHHDVIHRIQNIVQGHRRAPFVVANLGVAVQVAFESEGLKPAFHISGSKGWNRALSSSWVNWIQVVQPNLEAVGGQHPHLVRELA